MNSSDILVGQTVYLVMFAGMLKSIYNSEDKAKKLVSIYEKKYELVKDTLGLSQCDKPYYYSRQIE